MRKHPHGDAKRWLEHNLGEEQGPVSGVARQQEGDQAVAAPRSGDPAEDNLVQLPAGATFGSGHEPSPQERQELLRFAAAADAELGGREEGAADRVRSEKGGTGCSRTRMPGSRQHPGA
ncbi:hypothetical protein [Ornithinimicrobium pratense]|uniref:Uncharacterized protein n=1 Tax=Ornithinimicrobium pratense TaxID=2593973 RepID=A0A5J6V8D1_9MICO|nr:hypothetical protein [Ornithinimicrobium pratense]QFG69252.1 hypothetical protein FY030_11540 [Ornithinimicrobium pratense]